MTATPDDATPDPQHIIAELQRKLDESRAELAARNSAYSERVAYQAAANDVLKVMSTSPDDPQPVFDLIVERARDLCGGYGATVYEFDGTLIHWRAATGVSDDPTARQVVEAMYPMRPTREWPSGRAIIDRRIIHIRDLETEPGLTPTLRGLTVKSAVLVPLMRSGLPIGALSLGSRERGGFTGTQIELLKTFAEQAVIAITGTETYRELQQRTGDLQESLQQQTATAEVLKVISRSTFDLQKVLNTLTESAARLCDGDSSHIYLIDGDVSKLAACSGFSLEYEELLRRTPLAPGRGSLVGRTLLEGKVVHLQDAVSDEEYTFREAQMLGHFRTMLGVPMLRDASTMGVLSVTRSEVLPFTEKQIALLQIFADQAVIAIENARLFDETKEALERQTATSDVLKIISASPDELEPVFQAMLENAVRLCQAQFAMLFLFDVGKNEFRAVGSCNLPPVYSEFLGKNTIRAEPMIPLGRVALTKQPVQVSDVLVDPSFIERYPGMVGVGELGGARTLLQVPLLRDNELLGTIGIYRQEVRPFTNKQIELVQNFAAQAVIAIENARLLRELRQRTDDLTNSLEELRTAQDRLIQTEKLASLGQLTAGIAHEIKNPLNFVNNFSALSAELVGEMNDVLANATIDNKTRGELDELGLMLKTNLEKVVQHGKRADSIVKNMLLHSRQGSGEHRPVDINATVDEALNLAYHGARAETTEFNITLQRNFDPAVGMAEGYPQEITRVLLNLISNGFYATTKRKTEVGDGFEPTLTATTRNLGDNVEIRIRDNGTGIPTEVKEKIYNPFFTTKPAGEGTGLGLSMSHDIVVKQHNGTIEVDTAPGAFTEFRIVLPRAGASLIKSREQG